MAAWLRALALLTALAGCVSKPAMVASSRSPDGRLIARLLATGTSSLMLDIGQADTGPFTVITTLTDRADPFPLRWRGPTELVARLPCATTSLRGELQQQIMLPDTRAPVTIRLSRSAACKLPLTRMR